MDDGERLTEEHVEEDGEDNADWLWPSLVCAVKNGINKMYLNCVLSLVTDLLQKSLSKLLTGLFPGSYQSSCLNWSQC